ncbi:MAG TPA: MFS transporter [Acidimicrobiales bacterium]|nr:MFS transporter [Acidimicrobiales bacterium]
MLGGIKRWIEEWRPSAITLGAPTFPLIVLFGLNAVDELDRAAFAVLLPDIRDHFGMSNSGALALVSITTVAVLLIEVPLSFYCDRRNRVRIATVGAAIWALFSFGTGLAASVVMLAVMRVGAGGGRSVVTPTHSSLLSDFYEPSARVKVFSAHRQANSVGQILGPLLGGVVAYFLGWRWPFFLFAVPTIIFVLLSLRLREPVRGRFERMAAGATDAQAAVEQQHERVWTTMKVLSRVRTIRRIWMAVPFLAIALFGIPNLLAIVYEEVYGLNAAERGLVAAGVEPLQIVGVFVAIPIVSRKALEDPGFLLRFIAVVGVFDGLVLVGLAYSPHVLVAFMCHAILAATIGTLAPAFFAMLSIVSPPRVRSAAFSTVSVFGIPGIAIFLPLIGRISESMGVQASMLVLVPVGVAAAFILSSAAPFVKGDIEAVWAESLAGLETAPAGPVAEPPLDSAPPPPPAAPAAVVEPDAL